MTSSLQTMLYSVWHSACMQVVMNACEVSKALRTGRSSRIRGIHVYTKFLLDARIETETSYVIGIEKQTCKTAMHSCLCGLQVVYYSLYILVHNMQVHEYHTSQGFFVLSFCNVYYFYILCSMYLSKLVGKFQYDFNSVWA